MSASCRRAWKPAPVALLPANEILVSFLRLSRRNLTADCKGIPTRSSVSQVTPRARVSPGRDDRPTCIRPGAPSDPIERTESLASTAFPWQPRAHSRKIAAPISANGTLNLRLHPVVSIPSRASGECEKNRPRSRCSRRPTARCAAPLEPFWVPDIHGGSPRGRLACRRTCLPAWTMRWPELRPARLPRTSSPFFSFRPGGAPVPPSCKE